MIDKNSTPEEIYAQTVVAFNDYVEMVAAYLKAEGIIRQADILTLAEFAKTKDIYVAEDMTKGEIVSGILSGMRAEIWNATLTFKHMITFKE